MDTCDNINNQPPHFELPLAGCRGPKKRELYVKTLAARHNDAQEIDITWQYLQG